MKKTVLGVFTERADVEDAINKLKAEGFDPQDVSIIMRDVKQAKEIANNTGSDVVEGAASGATTGAVLGGLAGLIASFVIPGLGAFFIGGPIAAALGLGGAAATTASGVVTGAAAGGILGALTSAFGLSEEDAKVYTERVEQGAILVAVPVKTQDETQVSEIFTDYHASDVKTITQQDDELRANRTAHTQADADVVDEPKHSEHFAAMGAKGGKAEDQGKGWHGDSKHHSEASKGEEPHSNEE